MKKITYHEISKMTGVSIATISRVLNQNFGVSEVTRKLVLDAFKEKGVNIPRSSSFMIPKKLILVNLPTIENPFYSQIIRGVRDSATRNGYLCTASFNPLQTNEDISNLEALIEATKAVGMVIANPLSKDVMTRLNERLPIVQCCEYMDNSPVPFVGINNVLASLQAVEHLISQGRRRIALLNGSLEYRYARDRLEGYRKALLKANIPIDSKLVVEVGEINFNMALSATFQLLNSSNRPDAFFTTSDVYATAVIKAAIRNNIKIPEDISIIGFDNIDMSSMCSPSITTVSQPTYQIGLMAGDMLSECLQKDRLSLRSIFVETELILRETTK